MKTIQFFMLLTVCMFLMIACGNAADVYDHPQTHGEESVAVYNDTAWLHENTPPSDNREKCISGVQYIRTDGYQPDTAYPVVTIIRSVEELNAYYAANKDRYHLERRTEPIYADSTIGFLDACDKYDTAYFEDQILLLVLLDEGSGSIRHNVERVYMENGVLVVEINSIIPAEGTDDMAEWHILIEPEAGITVADEKDVSVVLGCRYEEDEPAAASYEKGFANLSIALKDGFTYGIENDSDTAAFEIVLLREDEPENRIRIRYTNGFAVCGTGLSQKPIILGTYEGRMGIYDNNSIWDFIILDGLPGDYAVLNECSDAFWNIWGEDIMQMLATLKAADGFITSSDAIIIARDKLQTDYEEVTTAYNATDGIWTVTLTTASGDDREVMKVTVDVYGNIIDRNTVE